MMLYVSSHIPELTVHIDLLTESIFRSFYYTSNSELEPVIKCFRLYMRHPRQTALSAFFDLCILQALVRSVSKFDQLLSGVLLVPTTRILISSAYNPPPSPLRSCLYSPESDTNCNISWALRMIFLPALHTVNRTVLLHHLCHLSRPEHLH